MKTLFRKPLLLSIVLLSAVGIADSAYLSWARLTDTSLTCAKILDGCNVVAASPYSTLFGVFPLAYLGLIFYVLIFLTSVLLIVRPREILHEALYYFTLIGFLSSAYFIYVQGFKIHAFCVYCVISATTSTLLFVVASIIRHERSTRERQTATPSE